MSLLETLKKRQIRLPKSLSLRDKALSRRPWGGRENAGFRTGLRTPLADTATFLGSYDCGGKGVPMCHLYLSITLKRRGLWVVMHVSGMHRWGNAAYVLVSTQDFKTSLSCVE